MKDIKAEYLHKIINKLMIDYDNRSIYLSKENNYLLNEIVEKLGGVELINKNYKNEFHSLNNFIIDLYLNEVKINEKYKDIKIGTEIDLLLILVDIYIEENKLSKKIFKYIKKLINKGE